MRKFFLPVLLILVLKTITASAQFDYFPECAFENRDLLEIKSAGKLSQLQCCGAPMGSWATSTLAPSKDFKSLEEFYQSRKAEFDDMEADSTIILSAYAVAKAEYDCSFYSARNLADGKPETAWVEGVSGAGIGEIVITQLNDLSPILIWGGYGKSQGLYTANNRPQKVRLYVLATYTQHVNQYDGHWADLEVIGSHEVTMIDKNGYQELPLPKCKKIIKPSQDGPVLDEPIYLLAIEILSVYKGTKYEDTCITEIKQK